MPPEAGPINDLHLELKGVGPQGIFDFFPSPFFGPSAQQSYNPATGITTVDFLPVDPTVTVPVSTTLHMGLHTPSDTVRLRAWLVDARRPAGRAADRHGQYHLSRPTAASGVGARND